MNRHPVDLAPWFSVAVLVAVFVLAAVRIAASVKRARRVRHECAMFTNRAKR